MEMEITEVRVRLMNDRKTKAVASITIDNAFVVHDLKVLEGRKGVFVAMPGKRSSDGLYIDVAHPIDSGVRQQISKVVLDEFNNKILEETQ